MISVIIPAYNREKSIFKSVNSVLQQSIEDIEVIVVDDGSTDKTKEIVLSIPDSRVKYYYQENSGACAARNYGIEMSGGEYIAFHDSDDICRKDRLEKQLNAIKSTGADMICSNVSVHRGEKESLRPNYKQGWIESLDNVYGIGTISFFAKNEVFKTVRFDSEMPRWQDLEILLRIFSKYKIYFTEDVVVDYYQGDDSITSNSGKGLKAYELIVKKHPEIEKNSVYLYSRLLKHRASFKIDLGRSDYLGDYRKAFRRDRNKKTFVLLVLSVFRLTPVLSPYIRRYYRSSIR